MSCVRSIIGPSLSSNRQRRVSRSWTVVQVRRSHAGADSRPAREVLPTFDRDVDVARINLDQAGSAPRLLGGDQGGAGAPERIEDDAVAVGTIPNRIGDKGDGFDRGVQRQLALRRAVQDVLAGIVPDVRSIPAEAAEFYIVDVRRISFLNTNMSSCLDL